MNGDLTKKLRERSLRVTPQRRAILSAFAGTDDEHLSADEVHARAARTVPEIGRGTVYATLAELTELGLLSAVGSPEPVRYETNIEGHGHFRCRICLRLFDVDLPAMATGHLEKAGFEIERVASVVEGVCAQCGEYTRGLRDGVDAIEGRAQVSSATLGSLACSTLETDLGLLALAASDAGIVRIAFEEHADYGAFVKRSKTRRGSKSARDRLTGASGGLETYLGGSHDQAQDLLDTTATELINPEILDATRRIVWGSTCSYEKLGGDLDAYDRGYAMGTNPMPILFPCHRVTRGAEQMVGYIGGSERRTQLIHLEGGIAAGD